MEIGFNNKTATDWGVRNETFGDAVSDVRGETAGAAKATSLPSGLTITHAAIAPEDIAAAEISDSALARNDALGTLIGKAFCLPPPPMPDFTAL